MAITIRRPDVSVETLEAYRACFGSAPLGFAGKIANPEHFLHCCQRHGLLAALHQRAHDQATIPRELQDRLAQAYKDQFFSYAVYRELLAQLHEALQKRGLQVVLLKGAALWFGAYSPPMLRHVSDIDILIKPGQRQQVVEALTSLGMHGDQDGKAFKDNRERRVDLHDGMLGIIEECSGLTVKAILDSSRPLPDYPHFLVMPAELESFYLALHAMKHSYLRLIWLQDVALSVSREGVSAPTDRLARKVRAWALFLHDDLIAGGQGQRYGLNRLEVYLARRMLLVDQHPLGKILLSLYQPTPARIWRCLKESARRDGDRSESLPIRLSRLLRTLLRPFLPAPEPAQTRLGTPTPDERAL